MKTRYFILAHLLLAMFQGCIFIPTSEHHSDAYHTRGIIDEKSIAFIKTGYTSKEEVLLKLGEPEYAWDQGRKIVYHWKVTRGYFLIAGGYSGGIIGLGKDYILLVQFDQDGRLSRYEIKSDEFSDQVKQW